MPSVVLECPHCGAEKIGFNLVAEYRVAQTNSVRFLTLGVCSNCDNGVVVEFANPGSAQKHSPMQGAADPASLGWVRVRTYPTAMPSKIPAHVPEPLTRFYGQAANALKRRDWDASGAMSRKVVDVSTQQLLGNDAKNYENIKGRIDALSDRGLITPDLKEWAHQIRLGGNDAAHDQDPFSEGEAQELLGFTELYLTYVYTLPGSLKERKAKAGEKKTVEEA
jgi:uncharacterized protein DUF4145